MKHQCKQNLALIDHKDPRPPQQYPLPQYPFTEHTEQYSGDCTSRGTSHHSPFHGNTSELRMLSAHSFQSHANQNWDRNPQSSSNPGAILKS